MALLIYLGLGAVLALEEAGLFFLPGDISLVAAGLRASPYHTHLVLFWMAGSAGMVVGASILFHLVARSGRMGRVLPRRVRRLIRRHGVLGVAAARLVPGLRNATVFAAASSRMPYPRFVCGLAPAALLWTGLLLLLGWFGGGAMLGLVTMIHQSVAIQMLSLSCLLAAGTFLLYRLRLQRLRQAAVPSGTKP